jgi:hypothetical protein
MADVRIVPSSLSKEANVVAFIERLDGLAFPANVDVLGLGDLNLPVQIESPDNRIYFIPPGGVDGSFSQVSLPSGEVLAFDSDLGYVDEQLACAQSLRAQMSVRRHLAQAKVESDRGSEMPEDLVLGACLSNRNTLLVGRLRRQNANDFERRAR